MREVQKTVYYCGFCKRHGLSRHAMAKHERSCTLNPVRVCRWRIDGHSNGALEIDISWFADGLRQRAGGQAHLAQEDLDWLHDELGGCPACMLAALRQSGLEYHYARGGGTLFDYQQAVEELRKHEHEEARADAW